MRIAPIPPTALLEQCSTDYHLCLAHLLGNDSRQMDFYKRRAYVGEYVILDNGAYEFGCSIPFEHVLDVAKEIKPKEIVLPDVFLKASATIDLALAGFDLLRHDPQWEYTDLMAVPQGRNTDEWVACLKVLVAEILPDTIGIPIVYESMMGRGILIHKAVEFLHDHPTCHPDIHLLGWDRDLYKLNAYARQFPLWLRGIDSAKPIYFAQRPEPKSILSGEDLKRPDDYFYLNAEDVDLQVVEYNIKCMRLASEGDLAQLFL